MGERDSWGVRDGYIHTAVFKMDNQQGPTVRSSVQCCVLAWMGWEFGGERLHVHMWVVPFPVHLSDTHCLLISYTSLQNRK